MLIIGITGTHGAGKGTIVDYLLLQKHFKHYSVRNFLIEEIKRRGIEIHRNNMLVVANDLRKKYEPGYIIKELLKDAEKENVNCIIESVRAVTEVEALKKYKNAYLFAIDADPKIRYERAFARKSDTDKVTFEKFLQDEKDESISQNPKESNIQACMKMADYTFKNNGDLASLHKQIDDVLDNLPMYQ